ncbi:arylesterase [Prosthecobacter algae]|uniref:Arylesterase n=1 Tax=Prosthecobacter algae TaxID=1144682 RepID=A0ABP9P5Y4_9BACT
MATLPAQTPAVAKKRIVVLGDSISAGYGLDRDQAYPALLQKKVDAEGLPYEVVNAGVSGDTTAGGLRRIDWALGPKGADVLVIALGGNDGLRGVSPDQTEKNLTGIVAKARAKNPTIKILIAGMQMPDNLGPKYVEAFKAVFPKVSTTEKTDLLPYLLEGVGGDEKLNQPDRIHPTAEGQQKIADMVWAKLKAMLPEAGN